MTEPSDKAVEAAAEAIYDNAIGYGLNGTEADNLATAALQAAYPIIEADIRAKIAAEIEAIPYSPELEHGDNGEWMQAEAARIARGEASA